MRNYGPTARFIPASGNARGQLEQGMSANGAVYGKLNCSSVRHGFMRRAFSPRRVFDGLFPRAMPQAGMARAVGAKWDPRQAPKARFYTGFGRRSGNFRCRCLSGTVLQIQREYNTLSVCSQVRLKRRKRQQSPPGNFRTFVCVFCRSRSSLCSRSVFTCVVGGF